MKINLPSIKQDPAYFFFTLFVFLSFISTLAGQIALVLSFVFVLANKDARHRFRMTWPTWGWLAYLFLAVIVSGIMLAVNSDELLNPGRGFTKIFEHLTWYAAIPLASSLIASRERFEKIMRVIGAAGLVLALVLLARNPFLAWLRYSYPNPGEIKVLQSVGLDVTEDRHEMKKILVRNAAATGGIIGADASGAPANGAAVFVHDFLEKCGLEKKATAWVFSVKPRRKIVDKSGTPKVLRHGHSKWNWYSWNSDGTKKGSYYLTKRELYFNVFNNKDEASAKSGNRPSTFLDTLEALGEHGDAQRLLFAFLAALLVSCLNWRSEHGLKRMRAILVPLVILAAMGVTFKEGAFCVSLISAAFILLSFFCRGWWKFAFCSVFLLVASVAVISTPQISSKLKNSGNPLVMREYKKGGRMMMWMDIVPAVHAEHPFGTGFKGITSAKMQSVNYAVEPREHVHNVLLQVFLDFGYAGVAVWLFWMLASLYSGLRLMGMAESQLAILPVSPEPSGAERGASALSPSHPLTSDNCTLGNANSTVLFRFPFVALCALLAVGVIEYNLPDSESVLMYSLAMGLACPFFASEKKIRKNGIAFLEKVFLCPKKGGCESLRGVELFNLNLVKDLISEKYSVFLPVDKTWLPTVNDFLGKSDQLVLCPVSSLHHPVLNGLSAACSIRDFASANGKFGTLFVANDVDGMIPAVYLLKNSDVFEQAVVFAHKLPGKLFIRSVSDVSGHIVCVCESVAVPFRNAAPKASVHADYGISGGNSFYPAPAGNKNMSTSVKFCLVGGLDSDWKGADTAVEAFKSLPEYIRKRSELHLMAFKEKKDFGDERIICHDWIRAEAVPEFLRSMDVMLAPSRNRESDNRLMETFSQVVVQGMLTGLPVIHTSIPVFVEKFDNGGGLQADSAPEFTEAMVKLAEDPNLRTRLGSAARTTALARYVWDTARFSRRYLP